jgi:exosome complex RNA-binding protein Rrp42 (RNase PH superfamily)
MLTETGGRIAQSFTPFYLTYMYYVKVYNNFSKITEKVIIDTLENELVLMHAECCITPKYNKKLCKRKKLLQTN